jgi:O-antigen/teichoic acid export membrane protein
MLILLTISAISQIGWGIPRFLRIKEYLSFGLPTLPANLSAWVVYFSDRFVIAHFLGVASVGTYSVAYVIGSLPITVASIFGTILPPTLSRLYDQGKITELITLLRYSLKYSMTVAIPFVFGAAFLARPVLLLFSTPEIASQGTVVLAVEAVNSLVLVFGSILNHALVPVKKTRIIGLAWLVGAIINLGLNLVTVPLLGIVGAVIGTLIAYIVAEGIQLYRSFKEFKLFVDWLFLLKSVAASAVMSLIVWLLDPQGMVSTVFVVAIGVIVYGVTLMLLRGFDKKEIQFFLGLFGRRSNTSI